MLIQRSIEKILPDYFNQGRAIIIYGARQVGKTTLIKNLVKKLSLSAKWFLGDAHKDREILFPHSVEYLKKIIGHHRIVVIDEAQKIPEIDNTIKLLVDNIDVQVLVTGSSAYILRNKTNESLSGRKWVFKLFPLSFSELSDFYGFDKEISSLEERLIFGSYPEVVLSKRKQKVLQELIDSYLFKDILEWQGIKKSSKLQKLLTAIALQTGSQVSYAELAELVGLDIVTVEKYIEILEQSFIIFRLPSFSRNIRNELKRSRKIFFWDLGIRNSLINNFNSLNIRTDVGALWENYFIAERMKLNYYQEKEINYYFWRTRQKQEINFLEQNQDKIIAYEIKWNAKKKAKFHKIFADNYKNSEFVKIDRTNFWKYLM